MAQTAIGDEVKALVFDVFGTVVDWRSSVIKAGEALFKIVDVDRVYVSAIVPEAELPLMKQLSGAELEIQSLDPLTLALAPQEEEDWGE